MTKILIGIDAGVNTGFAKSYDGKLVEVKTYCIIQAMESVKFTAQFAKENNCDLTVFIEDARKRKWIDPRAGRERLQGVGSVKRDCGIWEEFCNYHNIDFKLVAPKDNNTKLSADTFQRLTGWEHRSSEHGRDAAMLIWGKK